MLPKSVLSSKNLPRWLQNTPKTLPRAFQDAPKALPDGAKTPQEVHNITQKALKTPRVLMLMLMLVLMERSRRVQKLPKGPRRLQDTSKKLPTGSQEVAKSRQEPPIMLPKGIQQAQKKSSKLRGHQCLQAYKSRILPAFNESCFQRRSLEAYKWPRRDSRSDNNSLLS